MRSVSPIPPIQEQGLSSVVRASVRRVWHIILAVVGLSVLLIGIALLILPGPGWLIIAIGLGILGSEFVWARRLLRKVKMEFSQTRAFVNRHFALV